MKTKYILLITFLNIINLAFADIRTIHCFRETPNFQYSNMDVWKIPFLKIHSRDTINAGFKVVIHFSTRQNPLNEEIIQIGTSYNGQFFEAMSLEQRGSNLIFTRRVSNDFTIREHQYYCWNKSLLKSSTNYELTFEIDETRCRFSIWESGHESEKKDEYTFYGLMTSYVKQLLGQTTTKRHDFCVTTNKKFSVQFLQVSDLGYGVGVAVPAPVPQRSWLTFTNVNSNNMIGLYSNQLHEGGSIVQKNPNTPGTGNIWEMIPIYQPKRTPLSYKFKLKNMYTGYGMSILNCSHYNKTPLINSTSYSCGGWNVARPNRETNIFQLVNENTLYAVVKDASLAENATIWTWSSAETNNAKWVLTNVNISSEAPLKDGMYTIKNKNSGLYLTRAIPNYQSINIMQYPLVSNRVSVWYFKQEESGLYTIKNIDAMANMQVQNASLDDGADIIDQGTPDYGNVKWRIEPQSGTKYYKLFNFNSRKLAVIKDASKEPNAPLIQYSTGEDNALWEIEPYSYKVPQSISGMFWIKHVNSGWSLGIPGSSLSPDVEAEALSSAEGCNTWWSFNLLENGAYTIQNVNSQLYLDMKGATVEYLGIAIQYPRNEINNRGNSEWVLEPYSTEAGNRYFRIKNLHSGLYLAFLRDQTQLHDPVVQIIPQGLDDPKIKWELVPMQF